MPLLTSLRHGGTLFFKNSEYGKFQQQFLLSCHLEYDVSHCVFSTSLKAFNGALTESLVVEDGAYLQHSRFCQDFLDLVCYGISLCTEDAPRGRCCKVPGGRVGNRSGVANVASFYRGKEGTVETDILFIDVVDEIALFGSVELPVSESATGI